MRGRQIDDEAFLAGVLTSGNADRIMPRYVQKGEEAKGPIIKPSETSLAKREDTTSGSDRAERRLRHEREEAGSTASPEEKLNIR